jgi:hypothetical protein
VTAKPIILAEFAGKEVSANAHVEHYSQKECIQKGFKALGVCWLTAGICLFVPVIHLVVTPLALLAGPLAGLFVFTKVQKLPRLVEGTVTCQHCQKVTGFKFHNANPRYYELCEHCRTGYEILWPPKASSTPS